MKGEQMTTHINEKCTLMSNAKRVQQKQNELHTMYTDSDFLRLFNDHFDKNITGRVLTCDIELYNICEDSSTPTMLEIELCVLTTSVFYIVKYRTDLNIFVDASITVYHNESTL
jgi:GTP cyclohydrolase I